MTWQQTREMRLLWRGKGVLFSACEVYAVEKPFVNIVTSLIFIALGVEADISRLRAEPIVGEESLGTPSPGNTPKSESENAIALFKSGDYDGALKAFQNIASGDSNSPPAEVIMAQLFMQIGQFRKAEDYLRDAMTESPKDPEAYMMAAFLALRTKDLKKAESLFTKASELLEAYQGSEKRKKTMQPHVLRGQAALAEERGDWAQAAKMLELILRLEPKNAMALQKLAFYSFQEKRTLTLH